jgi:hypothetical protein
MIKLKKWLNIISRKLKKSGKRFGRGINLKFGEQLIF